MALCPVISDTWVSEDQFESEAFISDKGLLEDDYLEYFDNWLRAYHQLNQLSSLENDWDGDGASPLDQTIIESVGNWLERLRRDEVKAPTRIVADPDGAVVVEWLEADSYFEAEFSEPYKGEWMSSRDAETPQHGEINLRSQFVFADNTIAGIESRTIRGGIDDTTWAETP